jgi:hypothetical protein
VIAKRVEEVLQISGATKQLTVALELEQALAVVSLCAGPEVVDDTVFPATGVSPPQSPRSINSGGKHAAIGGTEAEGGAESREPLRAEFYHVRITSPSPALVP